MTSARSPIEFGVPILIIEPASVEVVGRQQAAVAMEAVHGRQPSTCPRRLLALDRSVAFVRFALNRCRREIVTDRTRGHSAKTELGGGKDSRRTVETEVRGRIKAIIVSVY